MGANGTEIAYIEFMIIKSLLAEIASLKTEFGKADDEASLRNVVKTFLGNLEECAYRLLRERDSRQSQEMQMEMALCYSEDAVSVATAEGDIRLVNPAFERLTGYSGSEIVGRDHDSFWFQEPANNRESLSASIKSGRQWRGEFVSKSKSGQPRTTELSIAPITSPSGALTHFVYIQRDLTEKKKMEEKIAEQKSLLEAVINMAPNAIMIIGPSGAWEMDNMRAKTLLSDMGANSRARLAETLLGNIGGRSAVKAAKIRLAFSEGAAGHYLMDSEKIPARFLIPGGSEGNLFLITLSDISELEAKSREALVRQKALSASKIEQGLVQNELTSGFIYRMRQPLNVGIAISARMGDQLERKDLDSLGINVKLMGGLVEKMEGELVKFKEQSLPVEVRGICNAGELLDGLELLYAERCGSAGIRFETDFTEDGVLLPVAEEMLQLVFMKLMDNACETLSGVKSPQIRLSVKARADYLYASVEDNGPGIPEAERFSVFEPFHTTKPRRAGLSLALVHQIINRAGGWVGVEDSELGGAKLSLRLPLAEGK
ncbi:MAG: PAS domain S-box protein [Nitrospinae bacterium]|nr:PAS domain S-box protein [Nitrospinota bacterium]